MVEYKKKRIQLQNGGSRNYYYKEFSNGKKEQISKEEYLNKKGGDEVNNRLVNLGFIVSERDGKQLHNEELARIKSKFRNANELRKFVNEYEGLPNYSNVPKNLNASDKQAIDSMRNSGRLSNNKNVENLLLELTQKYKSKNSERLRIFGKMSNVDDYGMKLFDYINSGTNA